MRKEILEAVKLHALGNIEKHKINIEIYLTNPVGIGEHSDVVAAILGEIDQISHYHDQLEVLEKYINK